MNEKERPYYEYCKGPLVEDCPKCQWLEKCREKAFYKFYAKLPFFLLKDLMTKVSNKAVNVYMALETFVDFNPESNNFGKCFPSYDTISKASNVKKYKIGKCLQELQDSGFIRHRLIRSSNKNPKSTTVYTTHVYTLLRFKAMQKWRQS